MPKIALCVFATGRYREFLPQLRDSARKFFLPDDRPDLVAFTDEDETPEGYDRHYTVPCLRWPYGTLYRHRWLSQHQRSLLDYDYLYMCDVDMRFVAQIGDEVLGRMVVVQHAGHLGKHVNDLPYIRDRQSIACVRPGQGVGYYAGGFQGGTAQKYLRACRKVDELCQYDERRGFIPEWHDEQYLNSYLVSHPPQLILSPDYCWSELMADKRPTAKILALVKDHRAFRKEGAAPERELPTEPAAQPALPAETPPETPPDPLNGDLDYQKAHYFVSRSNIPDPIKERFLGTLAQVRFLRERAEPRVCCEGPQDDLEEVLRRLLPSNPVVYVDVGAGEPVDCSNTWPFYCHGGHGLLVEPRPKVWYPLLLQRPRDKLWPVGVAKQHRWVEMIECDGCSSIVADWTPETRGRRIVETMPLHQILERFPDIAEKCQLLDLDIEGAEEEAIETWPWERYHPQIVVVEYYVYPRPEENDDRANALAALLGEHDYEVVHRNIHNLVFRRIA